MGIFHIVAFGRPPALSLWVAMLRGALFAWPRFRYRSIKSGSAIATPPLHSADAIHTYKK